MNRTGIRKAVIYGGMFDPPHRGHFALMKAALAELSPDALYVVPGFGSPFKAPPAAPFRERAAMLKAGLGPAGLGSDGRIFIHPYENDRGRVTYTWRTVAFFRRLHPEAELYFLMGSDCLGTFHLWKNYRRIMRSARLLVGARSGVPPRNPKALPYLRLPGSFPEAASTELKAGLYAGLRQPGLFGATAAYIEAKGLYLGSLRKELSRRMTPARFRHTLGTARFSLELALRYGADTLKTAQAALLHDAARELPARELARRASDRRLRMPAAREAALKAPVTVHPYAGAVIAEEDFGVKDREVLQAIRAHALGSVSPGLLEKIIFTADLAEPGRSFPEARGIRELALSDLDAAYAAAQYVKLSHAFKRGGWIHPESVKAWNSLLEKYN